LRTLHSFLAFVILVSFVDSDQRSEVGDQRSEVRGQRSEVGGRKSEVRSQELGVGDLISDDRRQKVGR